MMIGEYNNRILRMKAFHAWRGEVLKSKRLRYKTQEVMTQLKHMKLKSYLVKWKSLLLEINTPNRLTQISSKTTTPSISNNKIQILVSSLYPITQASLFQSLTCFMSINSYCCNKFLSSTHQKLKSTTILTQYLSSIAQSVTHLSFTEIKLF